MNTRDLLSSIDAEIARLQQARSLLSGGKMGRRGGKSTDATPTTAKRTLSPEARKRIADAQKKRWAAQKKATK
jgi:hypothetical protein